MDQQTLINLIDRTIETIVAKAIIDDRSLTDKELLNLHRAVETRCLLEPAVVEVQLEGTMIADPIDTFATQQTHGTPEWKEPMEAIEPLVTATPIFAGAPTEAPKSYFNFGGTNEDD